MSGAESFANKHCQQRATTQQQHSTLHNTKTHNTTTNFRLCHRTLNVSLHGRSSDGADLASSLASSLTSHGLSVQNLVARSQDGCSTNKACTSYTRITNPDFAELLCMSHLMSNVCSMGKHHIVDVFYHYVKGVFSRSSKAKQIFQEETDDHMAKINDARFFYKAELMECILRNWESIDRVVERIRQESDGNNIEKLNEMISNKKKKWVLYISLVGFVACTRHFKDCCYANEGDDSNTPFRVGGDMRELKEKIFKDGTISPELFDYNPGDGIPTMRQAFNRYKVEFLDLLPLGDRNSLIRLDPLGEQRHAATPRARAAYVDGDIENRNERRRAVAAENDAERRQELEDSRREAEKRQKDKRLKENIKESERIVVAPPTNFASYVDYMNCSMYASIKYFFDNISVREGQAGDRAQTFKFYDAANKLLYPPENKEAGHYELRRAINDICDSHEHVKSLGGGFRARLHAEMESLHNSSRVFQDAVQGKNILKWHWSKRFSRPATYELAKIVAVSMPNSCAAERLFSEYRSLYGNDDRESTLEDRRELTMLLRKNDRERDNEKKEWATEIRRTKKRKRA